MADVSEAAKAKACELINAGITFEQFLVWNVENIDERNSLALSFARFIQEVSDAAKAARDNHWDYIPTLNKLETFILPEPVDPLYEALFAVVELGRYDTREQTELLRAELAKRGLKIVEASNA